MPRYGLVHLLALEEERLEIIELEVSRRRAGRRRARRRRRAARGQPDHLRCCATARGFVPKADTVIEAGDEVLLVLDPGLEEAITAFFAPGSAVAQG